MNAPSICARRALARTTIALKPVALEAAAPDDALHGTQNGQRRPEKKTKKAMMWVKRPVKVLKAKRNANNAEKEGSVSPIPEGNKTLAVKALLNTALEYLKNRGTC